MKRSIRWIVPLVVLFVLAIALVVTTAAHSHAAAIIGGSNSVTGSGVTPTTDTMYRP